MPMTTMPQTRHAPTPHAPTPQSPHSATRHPATTPSGTPAPGSTGHTLSTAFLAELRIQWAIARAAYDDAVARDDDGGQQDAAGRLDELLELLRRHDLSLDVLRLGTPL